MTRRPIDLQFFTRYIKAFRYRNVSTFSRIACLIVSGDRTKGHPVPFTDQRSVNSILSFFLSSFFSLSLSLFHPIHRDIRKIKRLENKKKRKKWRRTAEGSRFSFSLSSKQNRGSSTLRSLDQTRGSILQFPSKTGCFKIPADVVLPANEYHRVFVAILRPLPNFYRRTNERKKREKISIYDKSNTRTTDTH